MNTNTGNENPFESKKESRASDQQIISTDQDHFEQPNNDPAHEQHL